MHRKASFSPLRQLAVFIVVSVLFDQIRTDHRGSPAATFEQTDFAGNKQVLGSHEHPWRPSFGSDNGHGSFPPNGRLNIFQHCIVHVPSTHLVTLAIRNPPDQCSQIGTDFGRIPRFRDSNAIASSFLKAITIIRLASSHDHAPNKCSLDATENSRRYGLFPDHGTVKSPGIICSQLPALAPSITQARARTPGAEDYHL